MQMMIVNLISTVKPLIKDTPKEDKPPNKGHTTMYSSIIIHSVQNNLRKRTNLPTKDILKLVYTLCTK